MDLQNLSEDERAVLAALFQLGPLQARTLAKRLGCAQSTLFRCLTSLEDLGLIETQNLSPDPLRRHIAVTPAGDKFRAALSSSLSASQSS